jgi:hypothetical protein
MKNHQKSIFILLFILPILFTGCQKNELGDNLKDDPNYSENNFLKSLTITNTNGKIEYCGVPLEGNLIDYEQTINPGTLTVGNDLINLYVTYNLTGDWWIKNVTLYTGAAEAVPGIINPDGTGNFAQWLFPYYYYPLDLIPVFTFQIDLNTLEECFVVVAYAHLQNVVTGERKYAWGKSSLKTNGFYMNYCKQSCPPPPTMCETAYAYGLSYANCFLNIPGVNSNNWGWSNGPIGAGIYSWPIYAAAGQCNIDNGILVGTLEVNYTPPTATIEYVMNSGYTLNETHLYVGNLILPKKNNKFTTAPGQFPYKHDGLNGVSSDSYTISGLSGEIYIAAHSVACWNL